MSEARIKRKGRWLRGTQGVAACNCGILIQDNAGQYVPEVVHRQEGPQEHSNREMFHLQWVHSRVNWGEAEEGREVEQQIKKRGWKESLTCMDQSTQEMRASEQVHAGDIWLNGDSQVSTRCSNSHTETSENARNFQMQTVLETLSWNYWGKDKEPEDQKTDSGISISLPFPFSRILHSILCGSGSAGCSSVPAGWCLMRSGECLPNPRCFDAVEDRKLAIRKGGGLWKLSIVLGTSHSWILHT